MKTAMTLQATRKETIKPTASASHPALDTVAPCLSKEYAEAAIMVGMARKNENSAATGREAPSNMAPIIVAAERDVPGIMARH